MTDIHWNAYKSQIQQAQWLRTQRILQLIFAMIQLFVAMIQKLEQLTAKNTNMTTYDKPFK